MRRPAFVLAASLVALLVSATSVDHLANAGAASLSCTAHVANPHPANYTEADIIVHTVPGAEVTGTEHIGAAHPTQQGVANSNGVAYIYFKISYVIKREVRTVTIVAKQGPLTETCRTSFDPT